MKFCSFFNTFRVLEHFSLNVLLFFSSLNFAIRFSVVTLEMLLVLYHCNFFIYVENVPLSHEVSFI